MKSLIILGRQPSLGLAELESLYGSSVITPLLPYAALVNKPAKEIDFSRLGSSIKLAHLLESQSFDGQNNLVDFIVQYIEKEYLNYKYKLNFGLSFYGLNYSIKDCLKISLSVKKQLSIVNLRVVPNKYSSLNSAQVLHNKLTGSKGLEIIALKDKNQLYIARTTAVQDIESYSNRDYLRPYRDMKVGMLPPKLAQIIINLSVGQVVPSRDLTILDPFCGSGVILQEAINTGFSVLGSDISSKMVDFSSKNIEWFEEKYNIKSGHTVFKADATKYKWPTFNFIASEIYLGRIVHSSGTVDQSGINDVNQLLSSSLENIAAQTKPGFRLCLAVPVWKDGQGEYIKLPLIDQIEKFGYNMIKFKSVSSDLVYIRPNQNVGRHLITLERN